MTFKVVETYWDIQNDGYYLVHSNWDDWFKYETTYLFYIKKNNQTTNVGSIKIGQFSMVEGQRVPNLPEEFDSLTDDFFSVATDESFYYEINRLESEKREYILTALKDVAFDNDLYHKAVKTDVFNVSLTRDLLPQVIVNKYRRLANGNTKLSNYDFSFKMSDACTLNFKVSPTEFPASNIHAIIGRNGVGKSYLLTEMVESAIQNDGRFSFNTEFDDNFFSNIISVNFSSFENKKLFEENHEASKGYLYYHLSNRTTAKESKNYKLYKEEDGEIVEYVPEGWDAVFIESVSTALRKKPKLWRDCIKILYSDPIFSQIGIDTLVETFQQEDDIRKFYKEAYKIFRGLSSGHKIVILTITKLVEMVSEKTLVILDEPELHLHPPLLSSFIRSLSQLLIKANGVAILATHSPIILQEVQKECVYKLSREMSTDFMQAVRPSNETFAEDIGSLTFDIFELEAIESGFYTLINQIVKENLSFEDSLQRFDGRMGTLGYKLLLTEILKRDKEEGRNA
ncbi:TPA: AAA family ATPase [Streptococcus pyogenes]|uniref:ATP-binding cassette domain-containing protein n=1 Tax=Streptococcus pyogenes TaxID=1314 RepID=A0A660A5B9_STRPY|nr:AAA family ATPase [Streptococcus pyogenes]EPZ45479.1 AAA domain protein [Streptococcus pyogenes GA40634]HER4522851.1 AAA family ATPase [Streptococcus pyogenes NGAS760]HER4526402.1 AAA family ATPase [Streptococcus pyogenes NGAS758]HER4529605.1 AAA family ATPase [Streptococcus pyogenes NGAS746]HER4531399.1 AAA family ATPase [Streptococcus pyogenes NGAS759]HER4534497.1 AAA family ATPase [Streptococcus pyogenes NGAS737]HER4544656.1 AAA family ATPase [Streptococcus pyogenes NGAS675]HER4548219